MENKPEDSNKGCGCCSSCKCGCRGGKGALIGVLLVLVGALGGFIAAKCCGKSGRMCPMSHDKAAMEAPATPGAAEAPAAQ